MKSAEPWKSSLAKRASIVTLAMLGSNTALGQTAPPLVSARPNKGTCQIEAITFKGWTAQEISNKWLKLVIVPQLGGRLMQVIFGDHAYLFVNPKYEGKYFPPSEGTAKGKYFDYGGDKIWPMPEGSQDDQHWPGPTSDALDDGEYTLNVVSRAARCAVRLESPPEVRTGLQYTREISIGSESPEISFHVTMKNIASHPIRWSAQSVTQYDTTDPRDSRSSNHEFWAFTPANPHSSYLEGYHVRSGLANDPSYSVRNGMFSLCWLYLQGEVWIDSPGGWLAVVDGATRFAMIERFEYQLGAEYPGHASVIFYKNGPAVAVDAKGAPVMRLEPDDAPFYMEAELNSPMVRLQPGESYTFNTTWFPTRVGSDLKTVTRAGAVGEPIVISTTSDGLKLSGSFGVFYAGMLAAHLYDAHDREIGVVPVAIVSPLKQVNLNEEIKAPATTARVSLHLIDQRGNDRGTLGEAQVKSKAGGA
jgi:hypothetical protein